MKYEMNFPTEEKVSASVDADLHKEACLKDLSTEDRQKLVSVFAWLMQEDKKQNPALYKSNKTKKYD